MDSTHFKDTMLDTLNEFLATRDVEEFYEEIVHVYHDELLEYEPFRDEFTAIQLARVVVFRAFLDRMDAQLTDAQLDEVVRDVEELIGVLRCDDPS
jgi:hypothetical protein